MQALEIRPAAGADRDAVVRLLLAQFEEHATSTSADALGAGIDYILARPDAGRILVAIRDGVVVAVAAVTFTRGLEHGGRSAWLEELYVQPSLRNVGVGTALLRAAFDVALA